MDVTVTNTTSPSEAVTIGDIYKTLEKTGDTVTFSRKGSDLSRMTSLQTLVAAGKVSVVVVPTADELASGLLTPPLAIQAADIQPVAAAVVDAPDVTLRISVPAGVGGGADDVTVYPLNAFPYKARVMWARAIVSATPGASTVALRTQPGGAGLLLATLSTAAVGPVPAPAAGFNASTVVTPGAGVGLFVRRSNNTIACEIEVTLRRET
jgi:hypothetical protein